MVEAAALHGPISSVDELDHGLLGHASPPEVRDALRGASVEETARHGKYLFVRLDGRGWLVLHFGMTGGLVHLEADHPRPEYTRLLLAMDDGDRVAFTDVRKLGRIDLTDDIGSFVERRRLGPDALDADETTFVDALSGRRGSVKPALMNQRILAGVGNIYADEICFQSRLDPRTRIQRLDRRDLRSLRRVTQRVLGIAIERKANLHRLPRTWLLARRDAGEACPRRDGRILRVKVGGRSTYLCPSCQVPR